MALISLQQLLSFLLIISHVSSLNLPLELDVKIALDSRLANIHLSDADPHIYPYTVAYGACNVSSIEDGASHNITTVHNQRGDRVVWILPEDIAPGGCLSAWSAQHELIGRSPPMAIKKSSRQWKNKRELTSIHKRAGISMSNASGIDAQGPWFDGVELLKDKEIGAVNVQEAKSKSVYGVAGASALVSGLMRLTGLE